MYISDTMYAHTRVWVCDSLVRISQLCVVIASHSRLLLPQCVVCA